MYKIPDEIIKKKQQKKTKKRHNEQPYQSKNR